MSIGVREGFWQAGCLSSAGRMTKSRVLIRRLIGRAERGDFSQCGAPGVPGAAAADLELGGYIKKDRC